MLHLNRRMALGALLGAAPVALGASAFAQPPAAPPTAPTGSRLIPVAEDEIAITLDAWTDTYGRPTASTMINGKGPFSFMVDTGSTTTVMSERLATLLGTISTGTATVAGTTGTAITPIAILDKVQTGAVTKEGLRVAILPDAGLARGDGILGADVFVGKRLVFAIRDKIVRVESSQRATRIAPRGNLRLRNGMLAEVEGRIGNISARLMLDTGADHCIANPVLGEALRAAHPRLERIPKVRVVGVTGHKILGEYVVLPRVDLKAFIVKDAGAVIADASIFKLWDLESEPAMIVGVNLLSRLSQFSIDYGARHFDAQLADAGDLIARNQAALG
jgi:predicted aspartyl protease